MVVCAKVPVLWKCPKDEVDRGQSVVYIFSFGLCKCNTMGFNIRETFFHFFIDYTCIKEYVFGFQLLKKIKLLYENLKIM